MRMTILAAMLVLGGCAMAADWEPKPQASSYIAWKTIPVPSRAAERNKELVSVWRRAFVRPFTRVGAFGDFGYYLAPDPRRG